MASVSFPTNVPVPTPRPTNQTAQPQQSLGQALEQAAFPVSDSTLLSGLREQETGYNEERCLPDLKSWAGMDLSPQQELDLTVSQSMPRAQSDWDSNMQNRDCRDVVDVNNDGVIDDSERTQADRVVGRHLRDQFDEVADRAAVANIKEGKLDSVRAEGQQRADAANAAISQTDGATTSATTSDRKSSSAAGAATTGGSSGKSASGGSAGSTSGPSGSKK